MKRLFKEEGWNIAKWGLTDFYEAPEKELRDAIESGEDFTTGWYECKEEIRGAEITRVNGQIHITVSASMDELYDGDALIYDALWETFHNEEELPSEIIESIRDAAIDEGLDDHHEACASLPGDSTWEEIMAEVERLETETEALNNSDYKTLCQIVKAHTTYMETKDHIIMAFADDTDDDYEQRFTDYFPYEGGFKSLFICDTPEELLDAWREQKDHPEGPWYWVVDHGDEIITGAFDPGDEQTIIDWFKQKELIWVELYRDSIPGWFEIKDLDDNLCKIPFPRWLLNSWYREVVWPKWYQKSLTPDDLDIWLKDHYTADQNDGLFQFALFHKYYPEDIELCPN